MSANTHCRVRVLVHLQVATTHSLDAYYSYASDICAPGGHRVPRTKDAFRVHVWYKYEFGY